MLDLVVIGGGIVVLFTALFYKRSHQHHHVVVLERGAFPSGASVKNAGFACFGSASELLADLDNEGADAMLARVENRWKGLLELRELGDEAIGFEPTGGHEIYAAHDPLYTRVADRFDALNKALRPIFGQEVFQWAHGGAQEFGLALGNHLAKTDLEGPLDSGALMSTILRKVQAEGVLFRPNSSVVGLEELPSGVEVELANGEALLAANVVLCTNGYARQLFPDLAVEPANAGTTYELPSHGDYSWENNVASPFPQAKTVVIGADDSTPGNIFVFVGNKQSTGTEIERAGLTGGTVYAIGMSGTTVNGSGQNEESATNILGNAVSGPVASKAFTMINMGDLTNVSGATLQSTADAQGQMNFNRPEDICWDTRNPNVAYFLTTASFTRNSRLWKSEFTDVTLPQLGGTITMLFGCTRCEIRASVCCACATATARARG